MFKKSIFIIIILLVVGFSKSALAVQNLTSSTCISNTTDEAQCKDCCDCLDSDAAGRKACRDQCATRNFSQNSNFISVTATSTLGPNGDYSKALSAGNEQSCKEYCDGSSDLACGDRRFCRDKCNAAFGSEGQVPPDPNVNPTNTNSGGISIEQAISDEAQRNTISFDGLAFLTGDICSDTFLPPGKVADFSGFQYFRDVDATNMGHNTDFVTIIAANILNILTDEQRSILITLAKKQVSQISEYGYKRFPLIKAFRRLIEGDLPTGTTGGLDKSAVMTYSGEIYQLDGQISYDRAATLGSIIRNMSTEQKAKIDALKALNGVGNWDKTLSDPLRGLNLDKDVNVAVMTYASEMYSWYAGSVDADTYFCPERQGTYFGSFYMKDAPAMAAGPGFTISSSLTADMGTSFLNALTTTQAALINNLVDVQRSDLVEIVSTRKSISTQLRRFITESSVDLTTVLNFAKRYGELDGEIVYNYAKNFVEVNTTLSTAQKTQLKAIRESWNTIPCSGAYLYSEKISMPEIINTDFLFGITSTNVGVTSGTIEKLSSVFSFAEGPAADYEGNIFFSDITANRIYKWSIKGDLSIFLENSGGANGLFFNKEGNLIACQGTNGAIVSIDMNGNVTILANTYDSKLFNEPNDLWIDPAGGIYFTDPIYFKSSLNQDGQHVYYLKKDSKTVVRVISDMVKPNGIIGTSDGKYLYAADHGDGKTYKCSINSDGTLSNKTLFASTGSDGMTIDSEGNIYLTGTSSVLVYNSSGNKIEEIAVPERPTNLCFGGITGKTLFITTQTSLYSISMRVKGVSNSTSSINNIDFNGDGKSDFLWKNTTSGKIAVWLINGTSISSYDIIGAVSDLNWEIINIGDFNGDGKTDFLWRNKANGKVAVWLINGTSIQSYDIIGEVSDLNWEIINVGDFNGDGKADLLWKHRTTGKVAVWLMNGTTIQSYNIIGEVSDLNWEIIKVGDFNSDGKTDLLWKNKASGKVAVWLMNGTAISSYDIIGEVSDLNWEIIKVGDFNSDGKTDLLWKNKTTGKVAVWLMNGTAISSYDIIGEVSDLNWEIIKVGDFNGDGKTDLLWKHKTSGKVAVWLMNGTAISSYAITGEVSDLNWEIIDVGDFNSDGKADLLWKHKVSGKVAVWLMNGTAISSYDIAGEVSDLNWKIMSR